MLSFGCQSCSLYSEDFFCSSLKLIWLHTIAYGFYSQTLADYNKKTRPPQWAVFFLDVDHIFKHFRLKITGKVTMLEVGIQTESFDSLHKR